MKVRTSYFYQIRNFKPNMIPMSTAMYDPKWFHDFKGTDYIFQDKRNILNGLRLLPIIVQEACPHICPCEEKNLNSCHFISTYEQELNKIDFNKMIADMENFCNLYVKENNIKEEPIAVLMVYETPDNKCSERNSLIKLFNQHGIECRELEYPIQ